MKNMYILIRELKYYELDKEKFPFLGNFSYTIKGVFDDIELLRSSMVKFLNEDKAIVGEDCITQEGISEMWYKIQDDITIHLNYKIEVINKLNCEDES